MRSSGPPLYGPFAPTTSASRASVSFCSSDKRERFDGEEPPEGVRRDRQVKVAGSRERSGHGVMKLDRGGQCGIDQLRGADDLVHRQHRVLRTRHDQHEQRIEAGPGRRKDPGEDVAPRLDLDQGARRGRGVLGDDELRDAPHREVQRVVVRRAGHRQPQRVDGGRRDDVRTPRSGPRERAKQPADGPRLRDRARQIALEHGHIRLARDTVEQAGGDVDERVLEPMRDVERDAEGIVDDGMILRAAEEQRQQPDVPGGVRDLLPDPPA